MTTPVERLDLAAIGRRTFEAPDPQRFPALALARAALCAGGTAPITLNAANEEAVSAFLAGRLGFLGICEIVERTLEAHPAAALGCLEEVEPVDAAARRTARGLLETRAPAPQVQRNCDGTVLSLPTILRYLTGDSLGASPAPAGR